MFPEQQSAARCHTHIFCSPAAVFVASCMPRPMSHVLLQRPRLLAVFSVDSLLQGTLSTHLYLY